MGVSDSVAVPADARVIDVAGKTVMPGLADMHVHLLGGWDGESIDMLAIDAISIRSCSPASPPSSTPAMSYRMSPKFARR